MFQAAAKVYLAKRTTRNSVSLMRTPASLFFFQAEDGIRDWRDWSSDVCSSDLAHAPGQQVLDLHLDLAAAVGLPGIPVDHGRDAALVGDQEALAQFDRRQLHEGSLRSGVSGANRIRSPSRSCTPAAAARAPPTPGSLARPGW